MAVSSLNWKLFKLLRYFYANFITHRARIFYFFPSVCVCLIYLSFSLPSPHRLFLNANESINGPAYETRLFLEDTRKYYIAFLSYFFHKYNFCFCVPASDISFECKGKIWDALTCCVTVEVEKGKIVANVNGLWRFTPLKSRLIWRQLCCTKGFLGSFI